ncbi:MAG: hypothetical protein R2991_14420 [Thermoanaerobaculia bacterium]
MKKPVVLLAVLGALALSLAGLASTTTRAEPAAGKGTTCAEAHPDFGQAPTWHAMAVAESEVVPTLFAIENLEVTAEVEFVTALGDGCYGVVYTVSQTKP